MKKIISLLLVSLLTISTFGCANNENIESELYTTSMRQESDDKYAQLMLNYIEYKYNKDFEIVDYSFKEKGINNQFEKNHLIVKDTETGIISDVYSSVGEPYVYYDNYASDLVSWNNKNIIDTSKLDEMGNTKLYLFLVEENERLDASPEDATAVILMANIQEEPNEENIKALYDVYNNLFTLNNNTISLNVGFTEKSDVFNEYVECYRVFGYEAWDSYEEVVYATMLVQEPGLSYEKFKEYILYN